MHYEDIEVQIAATTVLGTLCDPQYSEIGGNTKSVTFNGAFHESMCKESQYFRMRLGCYGFVYRFVLFVLQDRVDIQLLGLQCLTGLCLHPLNRITVALNFGLQPLIVHVLSSHPKIRLYTLLTISRLSCQPAFADIVNRDKAIIVPQSSESFEPFPSWMADLPNELVPVVKSMLGMYMDDITKFIDADSSYSDDDKGDADVLGESGNIGIQDFPQNQEGRVVDLLTHDNAEYFVKSGCITSLLTILLRSMRDVIITEELKNSSEDSKISETLKGRADSMLLTEQTSIAAISALIEFAKHSKHARRSIASEKIVLRLHEDQPNRSNLKNNGRQTLQDISGLGLHIILFFTTTVVNKYLRRVATELAIELAREEQNVIIFRNEIGLTDELINLLRLFISKNNRNDSQITSEFSAGDGSKTSDTSNFIEADFGESLSGIYLIYLATQDTDVQVRSNAVISFLELSIDGHTMDEIILKRAIQPVVDVAQSSFANNILKRRCAWALSSIGLRYAGMSDDVLGDDNFISSSLGVLGRFLLADNDYVTQREAAKGIAAFSLIEEAVALSL